MIMRIARLIDANALKDLREKYIRGEIHFDYEGLKQLNTLIKKYTTTYNGGVNNG